MIRAPQPAALAQHPFVKQKTAARTRETAFFALFGIITYSILSAAAALIFYIAWRGAAAVIDSSFPFINVEFLTTAPETLHVFKDAEGAAFQLGEREFRDYEAAHPGVEIADHESFVYSAGGILPCIIGTVLLVAGSIAIALFLGVAAAIYLSEYSKDGKFIAWLRLAIVNLSGVPSIVFGLFGYALFVIVAPVFTQQPAENTSLALPLWIGGYFLSFQGWGVSLLAGCFTLAFMILPVIITASEESLKAVPIGFREGSLALGATKWQSIRTSVLPYAFPGILTSSILGITRVAGETAPIMFTAAFVIKDKLPWELERKLDVFFEGVMALPYHIYVLTAKIPLSEHTERAKYGTVFVFLLLVLLLAMASIILRSHVRKKYQW